MADDAADATIELTLLSLDVLKHSTAFPFASSKHVAVAWVDPRFKNSTKLQNHTIHLPVSRHTLQDPDSRVNIQVLSRHPFRRTKLFGSATVLVSSIRIAGEALALQLRKPSGGFAGSIRVSARVMWYLGMPGEEGWAECVTGVPAVVGVTVERERPDFISVLPTAPPMPPLETWQPMPVPPVVERREDGMPVPPVMEGIEAGERRWRSFLVGFVSGAAAALLVGVTGFADG